MRTSGTLPPKHSGRATDWAHLEEMLRDKNKDVRIVATKAMGIKRGFAGSGRIPQLLEVLLRDKDKDVRIAAAYALGYAGPDAIPALLEALRDKDKDIREAVVHALANRSCGREAATSALTRLREDEDADKALRGTPPLKLWRRWRRNLLMRSARCCWIRARTKSFESRLPVK